MNSSRLISWILVLGVLGAGGYAFDRFAACERQKDLYGTHVGRLAQAMSLAARHPSLFSEGEREPAAEATLKSLVKNGATEQGLQIAFLSESEKDAGQGKRERQVTARLVQSSHTKLVRFLAKLEEAGSGARVKELHLRPSKDETDVYQDAEVILAKVFSAPRGKP